MAQNDNRSRVADLGLIVPEKASDLRLDFKCVEQRWRDRLSEETIWSRTDLVTAQILLVRNGHTHRLKRVVVFAPGNVIRNRSMTALRETLAPDSNDNQPSGVGQPKISKQDCSSHV